MKMMVKPIIGISLAAVSYIASATSVEGEISEWHYKYDLGLGVRQDAINFSVDGDLRQALSGNASSYKISPDNILEAHIGYRFISDNQWYIKGYYTEGWVSSGNVNQASQLNASPNINWAQYQSSAVRGTTSDRSFAIGHQWRWQDTYALMPLVGYSHHYQDWRSTSGSQVTCNATAGQTCLLGAGVSNNEVGSWNSVWRGPWLGLDFRYNYDLWTWNLELEHHITHYDATLQWSQTQTLSGISELSQSGNGTGQRLGLGVSRWLNGGFISAHLRHSDFKVNNAFMGTTPVSGSATSQEVSSLRWLSTSLTISYTLSY